MSVKSQVQAAEEALRQALINALAEGDEEFLSELFKLYKEVQDRPAVSLGDINIDKIVTDEGTEFNFNLSSDYMPVAAGPVDLSSFGDDVISFGDYKSQEYRPE